MSNKPAATSITLAVMSDMHCRLRTDPNDSLLVVGDCRKPSTQHPVQSLLELIRAQSLSADLLMLPGDLTNKARLEGLSQGWDLALEVAKELSCSQVFPVLGNHDIESRPTGEPNDRDPNFFARNLRPGFPFVDDTLCRQFFSEGFCIVEPNPFVRVILVNSVIDHIDAQTAARGSFGLDRIERLKGDLAARVHVPICVAMLDVCLRKIKPIVLIREAYAGPTHQRSRKNPGLYSGEEVIYAMSEGNPRLLAGLLNDMLDGGLPPVNKDGLLQQIPSHIQARVLTRASNRVRTAIRTHPIQLRDATAIPLSGLIERLGQFLHSELVQESFQADPIGSFVVDDEVTSGVAEEVRLGLLIGAFVPVSASDVPTSVVGCRIRLSYMLSPHYKLPFRNYRQVRMTTALRIARSKHRVLHGTGGLFT